MEYEKMVSKQNTVKDEGIDFSTLGIGNAQEQDRFVLDERGAMSITKFRFDYKTKYWNETTQTGSPITKFDGYDIGTGEYVKYYTLSSVIYKTFNEIMTKVGVKVVKDENGIEWSAFNKPINILGFEKVSTGVRGQNPYLKIKTS